MRHSFLLAFLCLILTQATAYAQDCMGMTIKQGLGYELLSYSAKDKLTGKMTYKITDVKKEGSSVVITVNVVATDEKGKTSQNSTVTYTCTGNELIADMAGLMQNNQNAAFKDGEMRMKANKLVYPALHAGQTLPDGKLEAEMYTNGSMMMEMSMDVTNRSVSSKESLTVPAGTFDVFKINADMLVKSKVMGMSVPVNLKIVTYRANNVLFDIRSETYNKNGKLFGYTVLNKIF